MELIQFLQGELLLTGTLLALIILLIVNIYGDTFKKFLSSFISPTFFIS